MRLSRRFAWLHAIAALAVALALFPALEVTAAEQIAISGDDVVHGGFYSDQFWASDFDALAAATGTRVTFGGTFHNINENDGVSGNWSNTREMMNQVWLGKATPFASVSIPDTAAAIARGDHDARISEWATHLEQYLALGGGRTVIIAPLQEANGTWTPYACDPTNFKIAYRRFVDLIRDRGIDETQVRFAFAPNGWTPPGCGTLADYYPGDAYVDVMGFSGYNGGTCLSGSSLQSVSVVVDRYIDELAAINATKPIVVAQTASPRPECGGDQAAWARDLYAHLAADRRVVGVIWFNIDTSSYGEVDWRIWDGSWVSPGWTDGVNAGSTLYQWPLSDWFNPGTLVLAPPSPPPTTTTTTTTTTTITLGPPGNVEGTVIDDMSGAGIPDVSIRLYAAGQDSYVPIQTDASGAFRADDLPSGPYLIRFDSATHTDEWHQDAATVGGAVAFSLIADATSTLTNGLAPFSDVPKGSWYYEDVAAVYRAEIAYGFGDGTYRPDRHVTRAEASAFLIRALGETPAAPTEDPFPDVSLTAWYAGDVQRAMELGLVSGYDDGLFRPEGSLTRGQMAAVIMRALGESDPPQPAEPPFPDVPITHWAAGYVDAFSDSGLANGYGDGTFRPFGAVTGAEMAAFLNRAFVEL